MLSIQPIVEPPSDGDIILPFVGKNAVLPLRLPPDVLFTRTQIAQEFGDYNREIPVGYWNQTPCYTIQLLEHQINALEHLTGSLYTLLGRVSDHVFNAFGRGLQLHHWWRDHRFCGRCGQTTELRDQGKALGCVDCNYQAYPRLNPCIIVAVKKGAELLLAAAAGRQTGFYSTLAGFIEPGESAEAAVAREVREEVGIEICNTRFFRSQAWPFPSQLMLGFIADYASGELILDPAEIADAGWLERESLPQIPPMASISGQLIQAAFSE